MLKDSLFPVNKSKARDAARSRGETGIESKVAGFGKKRADVDGSGALRALYDGEGPAFTGMIICQGECFFAHVQRPYSGIRIHGSSSVPRLTKAEKTIGINF